MLGKPSLFGPGGVRFLAIARQADQSRRLCAELGTQSTGQLVAVHHRQTNIEDGSVGMKRLHDLQRSRPVLRRRDHVEGLVCEPIRQGRRRFLEKLLDPRLRRRSLHAGTGAARDQNASHWSRC